MKLISLFIENFGKLHRYALDFSEGQNTVCEENGWGKSTLAAFIKAMFYGLPRSRVQSLDDNERKKYEPWQGGTYGGNLVFECARGKFRAERSFGDPDTFALIDLSTGLPSFAFTESLGQELFGIDADGFERSVYLSARALVPSGKNDTVRAKLTGAIEDANDMGNFERAYNALDSRAKEYKKTGNRGKIGELEAKIRTLNEQLREKRSLLSEQNKKEKELAALRKELAEISAETERAQKDAVLAAQTEYKQQCEEEIRRLEGQQNSVRSAFEGPLPSAEELEQARRLVREIASDSADLRRIGLDVQEQEELVRLSAAFPTSVPDKETMQRQYTVSAELRAEKSRIVAERGVAERAISDAEKTLRSLPSDAEISEALNRVSVSTPDVKSSSPRILFLFALLLSAIGMPLLILGVLKNNLFFTFGGGAALIAGTVCLLLTRFGGSSKQSSTVSTRDRKESERAMRELLTRCGRSAGDDPRRALTALSEEIARTRRTLTNAETRSSELQVAENSLRAKENDLRAFLAAYGVSETDTESGLRRLAEQIRDWDRLYQKQREAERARTEKKQALAQKSTEAERFFSRCKTVVGADAEERLRKVESLVDRYASLGEQIVQQKENLRVFLAEKGLDSVSADIVPTNPAKIERLKQKYDEQSEQEREWIGSLARMSNETEKIPELEEHIARLKAELAEANDRYRLLKLTCDYLKESREALTTRYLSGTRKSFGKYLSLLTGEDAPLADVNAEFGVTVVDSGMTRAPESYSRGWRDILQFCVRLSLVDALFENGEKPFLLLDDPFTNLDEKRLVFAKDLLTRLADEFQVLYLVCHGDRT